MLKERLLDLLVEQKWVSKEDLEKIVNMHKKGFGTLSELLVKEGLIAEADLSILLGAELNLPVLNLQLFTVDASIAHLIPKKLAQRYEVIPIAKIGSVLTVAMSDPLDVLAMDEIQGYTHCTLRPIITTSKDIQHAIATHYSDIDEIDTLIDEADAELELISEDKGESGHEVEGGASLASEGPVIRMVNLFLAEAVKRRASDIHFEPGDKLFRVRYRIDGDLIQAHTPPKNMHGAILARIKIIAGLDITEHRKPQDGRCRGRIQGKDIDFRVSILPISHGEKAVMRILDKENLKVSLEDLGFLPNPLKGLERAVEKPFGMIIITGPTGSGKSTTLYSILQRLNTPTRNIMTIEDPVEYQVEGITQTQVAADIGLDFTAGLRSLLRQSPDVILIGEIRDNETADIAAKAALTGHLVFSTLHTNSAAGAVTRLLDMKVEPFLIAASLNMVGGQRLCRKICDHCKEEYEVPQSVLERLDIDKKVINNIQSYRGKGCKQCNGTGFHGRLATMEVLEFDEEIRQMVIDRRSSDEIESVAKKNGMTLLFDNAFEKYARGLTTLEEVFRVASMAKTE